MKYVKGNITASFNEAYVKSKSRELFIALNADGQFDDSSLGEVWDLINGLPADEQLPELPKEPVKEDKKVKTPNK